MIRGAALAGAAGLVTMGLSACESPTPTPLYNATFQMYANVDAFSHLGSNFDALSATAIVGGGYLLTFAHPIGSCAAAVQTGKAGGNSPATVSTSIVDVTGPNTFRIKFYNLSGDAVREPFMITVTCAD